LPSDAQHSAIKGNEVFAVDRFILSIDRFLYNKRNLIYFMNSTFRNYWWSKYEESNAGNTGDYLEVGS